MVKAAKVICGKTRIKKFANIRKNQYLCRGYWIWGMGYGVLGMGYWVWGIGYEILNMGYERFINNKDMKEIISTLEAPAAIGAYSQAVKANGMLFASGQLGIDPATGEFAGADFRSQAEQAVKNVAAILKAAGTDASHVIKTTVFLTDMANFAVLNEVYSTLFTAPFPARSAVAVAALPKGGLVEIEVIAAL